MFERLLEAVRRETRGDRALADVASISRHHRIQSSPGYDDAAGWLAEVLRSAGLSTELTRVPADGRTRFGGYPMPEGWRCRRARATLRCTIESGARSKSASDSRPVAPRSVARARRQRQPSGIGNPT